MSEIYIYMHVSRELEIDVNLADIIPSMWLGHLSSV